MIIDALQYGRWSRELFHEMRGGGVTAVHATLAYHGGFRDAVRAVQDWNRLFADNQDLVFPGRDARDLDHAKSQNRTAIFFGFQTPAPIEDDTGLIEIWHQLGLRFMQLSYNNQSLLASGWTEREDCGITNMGQEVIKEMNRVGIAIDMSHSGDRSTLEAIELSSLPITVTHANPRSWCHSGRNKPDDVIRALVDSGGMFGFSIYPLHLVSESNCSLVAFCEMIARTADRFGIKSLGLGTDLCQGRAAASLQWMRDGRWRRNRGPAAAFPEQPDWFRNNLGFRQIAGGLEQAGFEESEIKALMGGNWHRYFGAVFGSG